MAKQTQKSAVHSRKHLARVERENIQKRIITIATVMIVSIVVLIAVFGTIKEGVLDPQKPIITIGDYDVSLAQFQARVRYQRFQLVNQYANYYNLMQSFGDESTQALLENNLRQIQFQLEPVILGTTVVDDIVADLLVQQEAEKRGITVSEAEITQFIAENFFMYFPEGTPTPEPTRELPPTSTLSPKQLTLVPQEPTATPEEAAIEETPAEAEPTAELPTATPFTEDALKTQLNEYLDYIKIYADVTEADLRWMIKADIYQEKLIKALTDDLETEEEQAWARHILVADEETALGVIERLNNGEDFIALAQELSTDTGSASQGGDLDWFGHGQMVEAFDLAVFELEIGEISTPVESNFGWHVIQLLGREVRTISEQRLATLKEQIFQDWVTQQRANTEVTISETWSENIPEEPAIPPEIALP